MKINAIFIVNCAALLVLTSFFSMAQSISDPTRPPSNTAMQNVANAQVDIGFTLSAVFQKAQKRYAIINGDVVKTGDVFDGMKVIKISEKQVTLQEDLVNGETIILDILPTAFSKTKATKKVTQ